MKSLRNGIVLNILGMGAAILGMQAILLDCWLLRLLLHQQILITRVSLPGPILFLHWIYIYIVKI